MDPYIFVLLPWFIGNLLAYLPIGRRLMVSLSKSKIFQRIFPLKKERQSVGGRISSFLFGFVPLFLTVMICSCSIRYVISAYKVYLSYYLLIVLLFSFLFFLSTVWLHTASMNSVPPQ